MASAATGGGGLRTRTGDPPRRPRRRDERQQQRHAREPVRAVPDPRPTTSSQRARSLSWSPPSTLPDPGTASTPTISPDQMTHLTLRFDHQFRFNTGAAPVCTAALASATTSQAKSICPPGSDVGSGTATFCANNHSGGCVVFLG